MLPIEADRNNHRNPPLFKELFSVEQLMMGSPDTKEKVALQLLHVRLIPSQKRGAKRL